MSETAHSLCTLHTLLTFYGTAFAIKLICCFFSFQVVSKVFLASVWISLSFQAALGGNLEKPATKLSNIAGLKILSFL